MDGFLLFMHSFQHAGDVSHSDFVLGLSWMLFLCFQHAGYVSLRLCARFVVVPREWEVSDLWLGLQGSVPHCARIRTSQNGGDRCGGE